MTEKMFFLTLVFIGIMVLIILNFVQLTENRTLKKKVEELTKLLDDIRDYR